MGESSRTPPSPDSAAPNLRRPPKLLYQVGERVRRLGYSIRTEHAYVHWVKRFVLFHGKRHPRDMGAPQVEAFLTHLAIERNVAAATQNQTLSTLLFLYKEVLGVELAWLDDVQRARKPQRLPTVLTVTEVRTVLARMTGTPAVRHRNATDGGGTAAREGHGVRAPRNHGARW